MSRHHSNENLERTTRSSAPEVRGDRASEDAQRTQDGTISDEEFAKLLTDEFDETVLPKPPSMPGWHLCWLTTSSTYDTPQRRQRLGYQPVRIEEMPGFDPSNGKSLSGHEGFVTCNEMVLFKIREERYQQLMVHYHHKKPLQEEEAIYERARESAEEHQKRSGKPVQLGSGYLDMEKSVRRGEQSTPTFAST